MTVETSLLLVLSPRFDVWGVRDSYHALHALRLTEGGSRPVISLHRLVRDVSGLDEELAAQEVRFVPTRPGTIIDWTLLVIAAFCLGNEIARSAFSVKPLREHRPQSGDYSPHVVLTPEPLTEDPDEFLVDDVVNEIADKIRIGVVELSERGFFQSEGGFEQFLAYGLDVQRFSATTQRGGRKQ